MTDGPIRLEVDGVSVAFGGRSALSDVHLKVAPGEIVALLGPSGSARARCCASSPA